MNDRHAEQALERRIVAALDRDTEARDPAVSHRLDGARRRALKQPVRSRRAWLSWPALAAAASAALVALVVLIQPLRHSGSEIPALPKTEDVDLLTAEEFELLTDDPEFFAWLAERPVQRRQRDRIRQEENT